MVAVLDQYEVEYKETYTSGTYDQVVMGKMFYPITTRGITQYVYSNRGVVYGSINSIHAPNPGIGLFDFSNSLSYRLQPYREKAGNVKAAKHTCYEERIYDTLTPNPMKCFQINGASTFVMKSANPYISPGQSLTRAGVDTAESAWIMFDSYVPEENAGRRKVFNPVVDRYWTKSFPFEPRYSAVEREKQQSFSDIESKYVAAFEEDNGANAFFGLTESLPRKIKKNGLIVGTKAPGSTTGFTGPLQIEKHNRIQLPFSNNIPPSGSAFNYWAVDVNLTRNIFDGLADNFTVTGSCGSTDLMKILFGFGDANTIYYDHQLTSTNDPTGYARLGSHKWPEFRKTKLTTYLYSPIGYELRSSSYWATSPIIRGWKYGLYNALPDFSNAYFRQGKYGQFRDMLEQRIYTRFINEKIDTTAMRVNNDEGPVVVKFVDSEDNLADPVRTQSQNLSTFATSSLPFFDLQQRNRPELTPLTNLALVDFKLDKLGNITV